MALFALLVAGHFIGDFPFQPTWIAENKGKSWEINAYHALIYTATVFVVSMMGGFTLPIAALAGIMISHFVIDPLKARWGVIKQIWLDQILHLVVLLVITLFM